MSQSKRQGWVGRFVGWCRGNPIAAATAISFGAVIALLTLAQSLEWLSKRLWPEQPRVIDFSPYFKPPVQQGTRFEVTIENPLDVSLLITGASFRAEPYPRSGGMTNAVETLEPTTSYEVPISCKRGKRSINLDPPLKIGPKDIGAVIFKTPPGLYSCDLYVSLRTNRGTTPEHKAEGL